MAKDNNMVDDHEQSKWSDLWKKEDYLAIWLGFAIILICLTAYFNFGPQKEFEEIIAEANQIQAEEEAKAPFKTLVWYKAYNEKSSLKASSSTFGKFVTHWTKHPGSWKNNSMDAFFRTEAKAKELNEKTMPKFEKAKAVEADALAVATDAEKAAAAAAFKDDGLNQIAKEKIAEWRMAYKALSEAKQKIEQKAYNYIPTLMALSIFFAIVFGFGAKMMGENFKAFIQGFVIVFLVATLAYLLSGQVISKQYGFGAEAWGILLGMIIANTLGTPRWVLPAPVRWNFLSRPALFCWAQRYFSIKS